jgi:hypothetical protein
MMFAAAKFGADWRLAHTGIVMRLGRAAQRKIVFFSTIHLIVMPYSRRKLLNFFAYIKDHFSVHLGPRNWASVSVRPGQIIEGPARYRFFRYRHADGGFFAAVLAEPSHE